MDPKVPVAPARSPHPLASASRVIEASSCIANELPGERTEGTVHKVLSVWHRVDNI